MKNEYTITKRLMLSWANGWYFNGVLNIILFILLCFVVAFYGFAAANAIYIFGDMVTIGAGVPKLYAFIINAAFLLLLYFIPTFPRLTYASQYNISAKNYCVKRWQREIDLRSDEIVVYDHNSILRFEYSTIKKVIARRNVIIIFLKSGYEIRLYRKAFTSGSMDECKAFLAEKRKMR